MFEVREITTNETYAVRANMGRAMDSADALHLGTGKHFCVVELRNVYCTSESMYKLRPSAEVLSRAGNSLKDGYERFSSLFSKLRVTRNG